MEEQTDQQAQGVNTSTGVGIQPSVQSQQDQQVSQAHQAPQAASVPSGLEYQGVGRRLIAVIIDTVITFFGFGLVIALLTGGMTDKGFSLEGWPAMVSYLLAFLYFIVMEAFLGATLGKMILGIKVVKEDGGKIDFVASLVRNILRIADYFPFGLLGIGLFMVLKSPQKQRLGDKLAHTVVVKK